MSIKTINLNGSSQSIDPDIKTINGNSLKGNGDLALQTTPQGTLIWEGTKEITTTESTWNPFTSIGINLDFYSTLFLWLEWGSGAYSTITPISVYKSNGSTIVINPTRWDSSSSHNLNSLQISLNTNLHLVMKAFSSNDVSIKKMYVI